MEKVKLKLGMKNCYVVDSKGASGGMALFWKDDLNVSLTSYSHFHISTKIKQRGNKGEWLMTGFYGHPLISKRSSSWNLLNTLKPTDNVPWFCVGDYNEILYNGEKYGGGMRPYSQMEAFRQSLILNGVSDLGYVGDKFTWCNNRQGPQFTKERLDRACASAKWIEMFLDSMVSIEAAQKSDHRPLIISISSRSQFFTREEWPLRYEACWATREECHKIVNEAWKGSVLVQNKLDLAITGLSRCKDKLKKWGKAIANGLSKEHQAKRQQLSYLQKANIGNLTEEIRAKKQELDKLLEEEDKKWRQRAKQKWLREGDRNTKFFTNVPPKEGKGI
ncbi:uncharacterized protein LOC121242293 [Juglans microcarpa x Juglans regia]|uniref:uncharacterized protein LOC121242293 n=1 Tax=Juglans microcarpa x Juglans regia TaxID=2249226 RepID=UPI001B7DA354|nr:uncharacterized protein LOC121242293 [Juglans microcarpa x Juglans regia]